MLCYVFTTTSKACNESMYLQSDVEEYVTKMFVNCINVISNRYEQVFLPKCPLTTVRSHFSVDELQIVQGEAEDTFVVLPH